MNGKLLKTGAVMLSALTLLMQQEITFPGEHVKASAAAAVSKNQAVNLNGSSSLSIRDAQLMMQDKGLMLSYTVTITNNGTKELDILDYWLRVKGKAGKVFKTTITEDDKNVKTVAAKSSVNLTYYAAVDNQTKIGDISFDVIKWDFSAANYERKLGTLTTSSNGKIAAYLPGVFLYEDTKIKGAIKQFYTTQDQSYLYVTISYLLENVGYSSTTLANLGFAIQTESYSVFDVAAAGLNTMTIQPKERKIVTMQAKLPLSVAGKVASLIPYTNDTATKTKLPNGQFTMPAIKPAAAVAAGASKMSYLEGQQVKTYANNAVLNENDGETEASLDFNLTNIGTESISLPKLEFSIMTPSNVSYPLTYTAEENKSLLPQIEQTLNLTGTIPAAASGKALKLVVRTAATEASQSYVVGMYNIQTTAQSGSVGGAFVYDTDYRIKVSSVQRVSMPDNDALIASLSVTNIGAASKKTPVLNGYFQINGVKVDSPSTVVGLDQAINIAPNGTYNMVVYADIPYTTTVDNITFVLTQPVSETETKKLYTFSGQVVTPIPAYSAADGYTVTNVGGKSQVKVVKTAIFSGEREDYFYTEFEVVNEENRMASLINLGGYVQDSVGQIAGLQVTKLNEKVMPNGKALLSAVGVISKSFDKSNYQLVFGQTNETTANDGSGTGTGTTKSVVIKPVAYQVTNNQPAVQNKLQDIAFSAYTLSLHNITANLSVSGLYTVSGLKLVMDYDLVKSNAYDYVAGDHKIMFEFVNKSTDQTTYSKTYPLLKTDDANPTALLEGNDIPLEVEFTDAEIQSKVTSYDQYTLNVYDVVGDAKILLASKDLKWSVRSN